MRFGSAMPFAATIAATVVPLRAAIAPRVSPGATVTVAAAAVATPPRSTAARAQTAIARSAGRVDRRVGMRASIGAEIAL